jgi:hypothetical protein
MKAFRGALPLEAAAIVDRRRFPGPYALLENQIRVKERYAYWMDMIPKKAERMPRNRYRTPLTGRLALMCKTPLGRSVRALKKSISPSIIWVSMLAIATCIL